MICDEIVLRRGSLRPCKSAPKEYLVSGEARRSCNCTNSSPTFEPELLEGYEAEQNHHKRVELGVFGQDPGCMPVRQTAVASVRYEYSTPYT